MTDQGQCPCRSGLAFSECCAPYLRGSANAPTAEALMRSRFSAFCRGEAAYLVETHEKSARGPDALRDVLKTIRETEWTNLIILGAQRGGARDQEGHVEFAAAFKQKGPGLIGGGAADGFQQMRERSFFVREEGRWLYVDGDQLPPHQPKRNEPCWCGSGKKMKACHG